MINLGKTRASRTRFYEIYVCIALAFGRCIGRELEARRGRRNRVSAGVDLMLQEYRDDHLQRSFFQSTSTRPLTIDASILMTRKISWLSLTT